MKKALKYNPYAKMGETSRRRRRRSRREHTDQIQEFDRRGAREREQDEAHAQEFVLLKRMNTKIMKK